MKLNHHTLNFRISRRSFPGATRIALLGLCSLLAPLASATPLVTASAGNNIGGTNSQSAGSGSASAAQDSSDIRGGASGTASASFGVLRAIASSSTANPGSNSTNVLFSTSEASFRDDFLFLAPADAPELNGTNGRVTVRFLITGNLSFSSSGTPQNGFSLASSRSNASYGFGPDRDNYTTTERRGADGTSTGTAFLGIVQEQTLDFVYGQWVNNVTLRIQAQTVTYVDRPDFTSSAIADLGHTATWEGFGPVLDSNGNTVTNYTFQSASGTDYTQAVPEPGSVSLLLAAGAALGAIRRRRRLPADF